MVFFLEPKKIIAKVGLKPNFQVAEFGCGSGDFTIALAKVLPEGIAYALDIQEEPLSALIGKARAEGLSNIKIIQSDLEEPRGSTLEDESLDLVLITNIFFQSERKEAILKEAKRIIKPEGKIVIIEWKPDSLFGPEQGRVSFEKIEKMARVKTGLKLIKEIGAGTYHWGAIFKK